MVRLKICDSHLSCKVADKCLNVREQAEVVEWNKRWSPPFPCMQSCELLVSVKENCDRKEKKIAVIQYHSSVCFLFCVELKLLFSQI